MNMLAGDRPIGLETDAIAEAERDPIATPVTKPHDRSRTARSGFVATDSFEEKVTSSLNQAATAATVTLNVKPGVQPSPLHSSAVRPASAIEIEPATPVRAVPSTTPPPAILVEGDVMDWAKH